MQVDGVALCYSSYLQISSEGSLSFGDPFGKIRACRLSCELAAEETMTRSSPYLLNLLENN